MATINKNKNIKTANTKAATANTQAAKANVQSATKTATANTQTAKANVQSATTATKTATKTAAAISAQMSLMDQIQQVEFTIYELILYLDTHPEDTFAIEQYNMSVNEHNALRAQYVKQYGPLMQGDPVNANTWTWGLSDFPWDY